MATTNKADEPENDPKTVTVQTTATADGPAAPAAMSAGETADRDPNEIDKTKKKDAMRVKDGQDLNLTDPNYGRGGAYIIDEDGNRVPAA